MVSPIRVLALLGSLSGLVPLPAQQPPREAVIGEVRDRDGKPWDGATVHLVHRAHPGLADPRFEDRLEVQVDARGRFRAEALAGMPYVVWATRPAANGAFTSTKVVSGVVSGVPTVLAEAGMHCPRQVRVTIDASWTTPPTFLARAELGELALVQELQVVDGAFTTPSWPVAQVRIDVRSGGQRVHLETIETPVVDLTVEPVPAEPAAFVLPERQVTAFTLKDPDGKPIADATLFVDRAPFAEPLVTTGAGGEVELVRAGSGRALERSSVLDTTHAEFPVDQGNIPTGEKAPQALDLAAGAVVRGRVLVDADTDVGAVPLILDSSIRNSDNGWWWGVNPRLLGTAADGAFAIPGRHGTFPFRLLVPMTPPVCARLAGDGKVPLWPVAMVADDTMVVDKDLGDLRLDRLAALEVQFRAPEGTPPGATQFAVIPYWSSDQRHHPTRALLARTDRRGRMRVLLPRGCEVVVFAATGAGSAWGFAKAGGPVFEKTLDPAGVVPLVVVEDGHPLAGAKVNVFSHNLQNLDGEVAKIREILQEPMVYSWAPLMTATTDAAGRAAIVVPVAGLEVGVFVTVSGQSNMRLQIDTKERGDEPRRIEFEPNGR